MATGGDGDGGIGGGGGLAAEIEMEAYRRLFPLPLYERHLRESVRPDARPLSAARDTSVALGPVTTADGSALVKIGDTTMLSSIKLEVMSPLADSPDDGAIAIEFNMPPICSASVRPGRPAEIAPVISKQLLDVVTRSRMIDMKELSLISGKAAWMAYLDIYCLNADGSLFDAALLSVVAALSHLQIPLVSVNEDGRVMAVSEDQLEGKPALEFVNQEKRKLSLISLPFSLTCILHKIVDPTAEMESSVSRKKYIVADPTAEEEAIMDTLVTVVLDSRGQLVSIYKAGGAALAYTSTIKDCLALAKKRAGELQIVLESSLSAMDVE